MYNYHILKRKHRYIEKYCDYIVIMQYNTYTIKNIHYCKNAFVKAIWGIIKKY